MAKVYRLAEGNGYAERLIIGGETPSIRSTWLFTTSINPISREDAARQIRETRAAGLAVDVIGETANPDGVPPISTSEPWVTPRGWQPSTDLLETPSGRWRIETVACETKRSADGWTTYRYTWAVTFLSEDGRRVEFTALDSRTRGEIIGTAKLVESWGKRRWGLISVSYPAA